MNVNTNMTSKSITPKKPRRRLMSTEMWVFSLITLLAIGVLVRYVDLTPHVDNDFFFSSDDPDLQADNEITKLFPRRDGQIIISVKGNIFDPEYKDNIKVLCDRLTELDTVTDVNSITMGPRNLRHATRSPFWQRLLIPESRESSNVIVMISESDLTKTIPQIENVIAKMESKKFQIKISGFLYIVELIRRHLERDLRTFTIFAFALFGLVVFFIFHSGRILLGMFIACLNAVVMTFMITDYFGIKIGILTANLTTIIFVLTLSHIVFLTFNWRHLHQAADPKEASKQAVEITIPASFWAMVTTLLGFISLLFVQAKPLRELGISGAFGTVLAFIAAYGIYPAFLRLNTPAQFRSDRKLKHYYHSTFAFFERRQAFVIIAILGTMLFTASSLKQLNTDPSLLSFFDKDGEIAEGLRFIDQTGGSSPLILVLKSKSNEPLNTKKAYRELWKLQDDLEEHPDTGSIISLPTLWAEGKRTPFSFFVNSETILKTLEQPKYGQIGRSFITPDRQHGLFLIRMSELARKKHRLKVIEELKQIVERHDFKVHLAGGIYALQGRLSKHITNSLIVGLGRLILIFMVIAFIVSFSFRISLAMGISITIIPLCILGCIGYFKVPLDTISAPAANLAIAMGIDAMIHMVHYYRRVKRNTANGRQWLYVRRHMWEPIMTSMFIISTGFGIFFFSSFPPTQRFGGSIVLGTIIAAMTALFIFPLMARRS